ncbi:hypothetical protein FQN54_002863 [Arachnomyces sp. PD_36]|nr:hypothetical protein FQN54_002863 [Arachnomyces sp. PD_36]
MFGIFADLISSVVTILFPVFASYKALRTSDPAQLTPWLMYWVVYSGVMLAESWTVFIIGWFPFYSWIRLFALSWLVLPQTQGAKILYQTYVDPFLERYEREIDVFIGDMHEQAKAAGLQYLYKAIDFVRENVLGLPAQAPAAAPAPPAGAGAYAQNLLARFSIPSAAVGGQASSGTDIYSLLSSAVTSVTSTGKTRDVQAEELSASGRLLPRNIANSSDSEKARYISSQREVLQTLLSAFDREQKNLGETSDGNDDLAYGTSYTGLRKNRSDNSFQNIEHEDLGASSLKGRAGGSGEGAGWTRGWFGGSGGDDGGDGGSSAADFAQRSVEEIARASGVDMRR